MGGEERFTKNLINGFKKNSPEDLKFVYLITEPAFGKFKKEISDQQYIIFKVNHDRLIYRFIWLTFNLKNIVPDDIDILFNPQFKLQRKLKGVKTVSVFHDTQNKDIAKNFSFLERRYFDYINYMTLKNSNELITISEFSKSNIKKHYNIKKNLKVIYNPIQVIEDFSQTDIELVMKKYKVSKGEYYYSISAAYKHKNINVLIKIFNQTDRKLIISGPKRNYFSKSTKLNDDCIIITGFVNEKEKNILIKNCKGFLFPSLYEGFGMPAVEALMHGKIVLAARRTAVPEITMQRALYIDNPSDAEEWRRKLKEIEQKGDENLFVNSKIFKDKYDYRSISQEYIDYFRSLT